MLCVWQFVNSNMMNEALFLLSLSLACIGLYGIIRRVERWFRSGYIKNFKNKHVLITGCDSGFGYMLAKRLDKLGMPVTATCLTEEGCERLESECSARLKAISLDVTNEEDVNDLKECLEYELREKGLYALVNNAGVSQPRVVAEVYWSKRGDIREVMDVNSTAMANITSKFLPLLSRANGRVINMTSASMRLPNPIGVTIAYVVSKAAASAFSDAFRILMKLDKRNVSLHIIEPGMYKTSVMDIERITKAYERGIERIPDSFKLKKTFEKHSANIIRSLREKFNNSASSNLDEVIDYYEHAILSKYPKKRYNKLGEPSVVLSYFPSIITDNILSKPALY
ncbi:DgyrCDS9691 [Dimorphilus gyrociliatus]|uniref:DgyrCDS9691 n=1 Tax=Dimorphilus gyrociliatus TaxID=2664684 RepID=A0A7I8VZ41_9ANNE|nr:DgyrCDS9691 [Dimorphilus gyrociliatus]